MRIRLPSSLIARAMAIGAALHLGAAIGAPIEEATGDACKLITAAQVSAVLGVPVDEGAYSLPGHTQFCIWRETGKPEGIAQNVQVRFLTTRQFDLAKTGPYAKGSESGLGEDAYWTLTPGIGLILSIKKGSTYIRIQSRPIPEGMARHSDTPADKAKWEEKERAVEKAIAAQVLKKL